MREGAGSVSIIRGSAVRSKEESPMKKFFALILALTLALSGTAVFADEAKDEYNIHVLVWKFDDTYGSTGCLQ